METVQHTYQTSMPPEDAAPGSHWIDNAGNHHLCSLDGQWLIVGNLGYITTNSEPPETVPERPVICTSMYGGPPRVWITVRPNDETWAWQELALVPAE
ncbi:hypothetical protein [Ectopseudomonas alcaliphila]|uniref:Uncharacterized protein n=1 Tax=Ectopseudomonas alcaliphila TaxID=101564 RepID=A0A1G7MII7_9GAMM|nr:hypothetical protein [Pseudomonas alcaliphila]MDX5994954.1 hypothetical protein [Pseudomonas alcaliphila]SDF61585.1 hypothetical protein SAMN05216575_10965 [Pseudomonas alcaliphila]